MPPRGKVFERVAKDVFLFRDTCNVYVLRDGSDAILIDFGSGDVLRHLRHIGVRRVEWVLHTHHHREQCQGDHLLQPRGIGLAVPARESSFFSRVDEYWQHPEHFSVVGAPYCRPLREPVPVDLTMRDGENFRWRGLDLQAFAGPGHSPGAMYYLCQVDGRTLALCGDSALAGAKLHTYYDSEWDYGYAEGLITLLRTLARLHGEHPDVLCPSHGDISRDAERDLRLLRRRLGTFIYDLLLRHWDKDTNPYDSCTVSRRTPIAGLRQVSPHLFKLDRRNCYIILADSGRALFMDCGLGAAEPVTRWL
ncbi:MAG: MBL fold metallo-hydrolase, partial [Armatimonadota bacterium]